jgi:hypothetical protein
VDDTHAGLILLVVPEGTDDFTASVLQKLDHTVLTCHGPRPGTDCPLVHGQGCEWFADAHGIVFSLDLARPAHRAVLEAYDRMAADAGRDVPIRVVLPRGATLPSAFRNLTTWDGEPSVADLDGFAALVEAIDRSA